MRHGSWDVGDGRQWQAYSRGGVCDLGHERAYAPAFSLCYTGRGACK